MVPIGRIHEKTHIYKVNVSIVYLYILFNTNEFTPKLKEISSMILIYIPPLN